MSLTDLPPEVAAMLERMRPRPERTATARAVADADRLQAAITAHLAGDDETAHDLLAQEPGSRPFNTGDSLPPSRRRRTE